MGLGLIPWAPQAAIACLLAGASYGLFYVSPLRYLPALRGTFEGYTSYAEFATGGLWWVAIILGVTTFAH